MPPYRPDRFRATYQHMQGEEIWSLLNSHAAIAIMETACYLKRPPVEALAPLLERRFGKIRSSKPLRRMVGHMIRQILEARGFNLHRANIRISNPRNAFAFGSTYHQAGWAGAA